MYKRSVCSSESILELINFYDRNFEIKWRHVVLILQYLEISRDTFDMK